MKPIAKRVLTIPQVCVIEQIVARRGVVTPKDFRAIADACSCNTETVSKIAYRESLPEISEEIDRRLANMPIVNQHTRIAYAQKMLDDQIMRRAENDLPLSDQDPMEILDYIRKEVNLGTINIDNRQQSVNIFDFSVYDDNALMDLILKLQSALDSGDIETVVDGEFEELTDS